MPIDDASLASFLSAIVLTAAMLDAVWSWVAGRADDVGDL